jgi:hypothetical protein
MSEPESKATYQPLTTQDDTGKDNTGKDDAMKPVTDASPSDVTVGTNANSHTELLGKMEEDLDFTNLPCDTWGICMLTTVKDLADICAVQADIVQIIRFMFNLGAIVMNLTLQIYLISSVKHYVVAPDLHNLQVHYKSFHEQVFDTDGNFLPDKWANFPYKEPLCDSAMSTVDFTGSVMFLWGARMMDEIRGIVRLERQVRALQRLPPGMGIADMCLEHDNEDGEEVCDIIYVNCITRMMLYILVLIPKAYIAGLLFYRGINWLSTSESLGDLIMNALALEFIIAIDELIYEAVFPRTAMKMLENTRFGLPKRKVLDAKAKDREILVDFARSIGYVVVMVAIVASYLLGWQGYVGVLPGYAWDIKPHCDAATLNEDTSKICSVTDRSCFPYGVAPSDRLLTENSTGF